MDNVSNQVIWEVIRPQNSFILKKSNGPLQFTREPFNPTNTHSYKSSSVAQQGKILSVEAVGDFDAELVSSSQEKNAEFKPRTLMKRTEMKDTFGSLKSNKKILEAVDDAFYRRDLKTAVLRRYTKLYKAAQRKRKARSSE